MPYVTSVERLGHRDGRRVALAEDVLEVRLGNVSPGIRDRLTHVADLAKLRKLHRLAVSCETLAHFDQAMPA